MTDRPPRLDEKLFVRVKHAAHRLRPASERAGANRVVLVPGVQRSGTNLLMRILDQSWQTDVVHETDRRAFEEYFLRDDATLTGLRAGSRLPVFVLKCLLESDRVREFQEQVFPGARILWVFRRVDDVVRSMAVSWPTNRNRIDDLEAMPGDIGFRDRGMTAETRDLVLSHYRPDINNHTANALFWYYRNQLLFDKGLDRAADTLVLDYEEMVTMPGISIERICTFAGIPYRRFMHRMVHVRSAKTKRKAEIEPGVRALCESMMERLQAAAKATQSAV